jgi:CRISPR-associated protein Cas1
MIDYNKPAMALDLEEQFRPVIVDSIVLSAINRPIFNLHDFEGGKPFHKAKENISNKSSQQRSAMNSNLVLTEKQGILPGNKASNNNESCPIYLTAAARKRFIDLYETRVNEQVTYSQNEERTSYRRIFELQAYAMARMILGETESYLPFVIR